MYLGSLELEQFRSYRRLQLPFDERGCRLSGANASGKSTILEAIMLLATTRSVRSSIERDLINWQSGIDLNVPPFARVRGEVHRLSGRVMVEIALQADPDRDGAVKKRIRLGRRVVRAMDAVGALRAVLFSPEDVALVTGSPSGRRRYLDMTISQLDGGYMRALSRYNRVLAQRNGLLKILGKERGSARNASAQAQLGYWDQELVALGAIVMARRDQIIRLLGRLASQKYVQLTEENELTIRYLPTFPVSDRPGGEVDLTSSQAMVAREFEAQLESGRDEELRRGVSLIGPHRDDFGLEVAGIDLATFGSRGQQRLAVVALKLAETLLMTEIGGEAPVLLLDDVLSELDATHRSTVTSVAATVGAQLIVTATDGELLHRADLAELPQLHVADGTVVPIVVAH